MCELLSCLQLSKGTRHYQVGGNFIFPAEKETMESACFSGKRNGNVCLPLLSCTHIFLNLFTFSVFCETFGVKLDELALYSVAFTREETNETGTLGHMFYISHVCKARLFTTDTKEAGVQRWKVFTLFLFTLVCVHGNQMRPNYKKKTVLYK